LEPYAFANSELALKNFQPGFYDFLLIDIEIPRMGGHELYDRLKEIDRKIKSCFITTLQIIYGAIREPFSTLGMKCISKKPINTDDLIKRIKGVKEG
jgi:CheY-like chemotaxis protein